MILSTLSTMHMLPSCKVSSKESHKNNGTGPFPVRLVSLCHLSYVHLCHYFTTDQIQEASVELDTIRDSRDVSLCTLMALVYAEKKKTNPGKPA